MGGPAVITLVFSLQGVHQRGDALVMRGALASAVPPGAERIVRAGAPLELHFEAELMHAGLGRTVPAQAVNVLRYEPLERTFLVERAGATARFRALAPAVRAFSAFELAFPEAAAAGKIDVEVTARLVYASQLAGPAAADALWDGATPFLRVKDLQRLVTEER